MSSKLWIASQALLMAVVCAMANARGGEFQTGEAPRVLAPVVPEGFRVGGRSLTVDTTDRSAVAAFFTTNYTPAPAIGWTGSATAPYDPGTISSAYQDATIFRLNFYRALAGLPATVTLDPTLNAKCQQAALMMSVAGMLSHSPPSAPNAMWPYATADGANAAGNSNLGLGYVGPDAMDGLMADPGSGNGEAGHRRWMLYPPQTTMGNGGVPPSGQLFSADALWVLGPFGTRPATPTNIAWPNAGYFPYQILPYDYTPQFAKIPGRWSFTLNGADFMSATVTMATGGTNLSVQIETVVNGYGDNTLVWKALGVPLSKPAADTQYDVTISNATVNGNPQTFSYSVIVFDPASASAGPVAKPQTLSTTEGTPLNVVLTGTGGATFAIASPPAHGTLTGLNASSGAVTYTPATGYTGSDSFTFTVASGATVSAPATISINVTASGGGGAPVTYPADLETYLQNNNLPVNATAATSSAPIKKTTLAIALNFKKTNLDGLSFVTPVTLPSGFTLAGRAVAVDIGGVIRAYHLDSTGKKDVTDPTSKLTVTGKIKAGVLTAAGEVKFTVKLTKAALQSTLAAAGLKDDKIYSKVALSLPVSVDIIDTTASTLVSGPVPVLYSAKPGATGTAKGGL